MQQPPLDLSRVFELEPHGPDTWLGESPPYAWGRIYGGLVIAQALWSATQTVDPAHRVHSLHAYFILGGDLGEPVRYEVDRIRNGRSFSTRRVVSRQSGGAILSLACSFQVEEPGPETQSARMPEGVRVPDRFVLDAGIQRADVKGVGAEPGSLAWARFPEPVGDDPRLAACVQAYLSDMNAIEAIVATHPVGRPPEAEWGETFMSASLDHAMWFHRPAAPDEWMLLDLRGHGLVGHRGLATGLVFTADGNHVATIAQEGLLRDRKPR
jgi:acyl-CoA thioesterase-2